MFSHLRALLTGGDRAGQPRRPDFDAVTLAAAELLVTAARLDGAVSRAEDGLVRDLLRRRFGLSPAQVETLVREADAGSDAATDLYEVTRDIKNGLGEEERVGIIEMLWRVAYADGELDDYEANMIRRVAGLLYVSDVDSGAARKRVLDHLRGAEQ